MPAADLALALMHEAIAEGHPQALEQLAAPRVMAFLTSTLLVSWAHSAPSPCHLLRICGGRSVLWSMPG